MGDSHGRQRLRSLNAVIKDRCAEKLLWRCDGFVTRRLAAAVLRGGTAPEREAAPGCISYGAAWYNCSTLVQVQVHYNTNYTGLWAAALFVRVDQAG